MIHNNNTNQPSCICDSTDTAFSGQSTKHKMSITSPGFSMEDLVNPDGVWYGIINIASRQSVRVDYNNIEKEGSYYYLCVNSESDWIGKSTLTVTVNVPDEGFPDGKRIEMFKVPFVTYIKP